MAVRAGSVSVVIIESWPSQANVCGRDPPYIRVSIELTMPSKDGESLPRSGLSPAGARSPLLIDRLAATQDLNRD
jgi:hypothetical protein